MAHGIQRLGLRIGQAQARGDAARVFGDSDCERAEPADRMAVSPKARSIAISAANGPV